MPKILIIERDQSVRALIERMLRQAMHETAAYGSLLVANYCTSQTYDCVIIGAGGSLSDELPQLVRETDAIWRAPVIVLTAESASSGVQRRDAFLVLSKPFRKEELMEAVHLATRGVATGHGQG